MIKPWWMLHFLDKCYVVIDRDNIFDYGIVFDFLVMWSNNCPAIKNIISATENVAFTMENIIVVKWWINFKTMTKKHKHS